VIAGTNMVARARRARVTFRLICIHSPAYLRVFHYDLNMFRDALARALAGLLVSAVAGLLFVSFLSVAVLISAWKTQMRLLTAWGMVGHCDRRAHLRPTRSAITRALCDIYSTTATSARGQ
jgi:hypothetical protein